MASWSGLLEQETTVCVYCSSVFSSHQYHIWSYFSWAFVCLSDYKPTDIDTANIVHDKQSLQGE